MVLGFGSKDKGLSFVVGLLEPKYLTLALYPSHPTDFDIVKVKKIPSVKNIDVNVGDRN